MQSPLPIGYRACNGSEETPCFQLVVTERDPQWPWRGLHETEKHHPLMQGEKFREFWEKRGLSEAEVKNWTKEIDKDIHRAISEAAPGRAPWWDEQLLGEVTKQEAQLGRKLTKGEVLDTANELLKQLEKWSPR